MSKESQYIDAVRLEVIRLKGNPDIMDLDRVLHHHADGDEQHIAARDEIAHNKRKQLKIWNIDVQQSDWR